MVTVVIFRSKEYWAKFKGNLGNEYAHKYDVMEYENIRIKNQMFNICS